MPLKKIGNSISNFVNSNKDFPVIAAIAAGLYPILFYYSNNYPLVNSWDHFLFFMGSFLLLPIVLFVGAHKISRLPYFKKGRKYTLPFLNFFAFIFFLKICLYGGFQKKIIGVLFLVALLYSLFFYKHYLKIVVVQYFLAILGFFALLNTLFIYPLPSQEWKTPVDDIEKVSFKTKPNIYLIQPDGYVNFSELKKGHYQFKDNSFEDSLRQLGFINYPNFRANYASTLYSNSATFMMKHHYYNGGSVFNEAIGAREDIVSDNSVLRILKNNGYKTHFISQSPYLLLNRPKLGYDYSNFSYKETGFLSTGFTGERYVEQEMEMLLAENRKHPNFYFIEFFSPGHINGKKEESEGVQQEKENWFTRLKISNKTITTLVTQILAKDPNALILILSDHGGFVGMEYTEQIYTKTQDRNTLNSIFSSQLSIHWPHNNAPSIDVNFVSSVNVFRILFSYLSENNQYLEYLQEDASYTLIRKGAEKGVYKVIGSNGAILFEKI
ncbi:MAG: sulfatase-like hydrolase/transferase [Flavobacteriaceae bacterium]